MFSKEQLRPLIAIILATFVVGLGIGRFSAPRGADATAAPQQVASPATIDLGDGETHAFQSFREDDAERPAPPADGAFAYQRLVLETTGDAPAACFQFTRPLDQSGETNYADYVRVSPRTPVAVRVAGSSLCLGGLAFDTDYTVTLRLGLPADGDETLARGERVQVSFGDKPAYVGFAGNGVIIPRMEADGVGIETVNVDALAVQVYRVADRSLFQKDIVAGSSAGENDYSYVWERENGADTGVLVFEDTISVKNDRNTMVTTVFSIGAALKDIKPGAYYVTLRDASAGRNEARSASAWRWLMFTDMALTTFSSSDGIDVFVRSLASARPMAGARLALIAANNEVLAEGVTNANGHVKFDAAVTSGAHPLSPSMVTAFGPRDDYTVLDLKRAPLDLSERNIAGRDAPSKADGYVWLDRGIYRPGETAHFTAILRDDAGNALTNRAATIVVHRPNGAEVERLRINTLSEGGFSRDIEIPDGAARGVWRADVKVDGLDQTVGSVRFSVEDFVPQRLAVALSGDAKTPMRPGESRSYTVTSRYLYGAPASDLPVEAQARIRVDPKPFPDFADYTFGVADKRFNQRIVNLPNTKTDADGNAQVTLKLDDGLKGVGAPLRADLVVGVAEPGGRAVKESERTPIRTQDHYVGLRLPEGIRNFAKTDEARIDAVMLDWRGDVIEGEVEWRLVEEDYWFDWYRDNGEWRWRRSYRDVVVAEGRGQTSREAVLSLVNKKLDAGSYRLSAWRTGETDKTDLRFYVGWRSYAAGAQSPDHAQLTLQDKSVKAGGRAKLYLTAPYEGEALILVATDKVHSVQRVKVDADGREIMIETDPSWGAGFYVMASIVTPRDAGEQPVPRRAMAVNYVPFDMSARTLDVAINAPDLIRPRQKQSVSIDVDGAAPGERLHMSLAAVDEGILRLTKFKSPDPAGHFYAQKRLGVETHDDYGRILNANLGAPTRFGGDQIGGEGLSVVPTKSIALFSGLVTIGDNGKVDVPIDVPDFNGELRLMAVAWSAEKVGAASMPMTVRDPVPALLSLPRFIAPGDEAVATLLIDNVDGAAGEYNVSVTSDGVVVADDQQTFTLAAGAKETAQYAFSADSVGIGAVNLLVEGPEGLRIERDYPIQSRTPYYPVSTVQTNTLEPDESFVATAALFDPYIKGSAEVSLAFSRLRGIEAGALLDALHRYPYGCSEQLTSTSMPLLFVDVLGGEMGLGPERAVRPRIQKAINTLLNRQSADGAFGLWRIGDRYANPWIGVYVVDFLQRAKTQGYAVPDTAMENAYGSLRRIARLDRWYPVGYVTRADDQNGANDSREKMHRRSAAYALYILARAGQANLSDLRYFHDSLIDQTPSPLARAHVGAALTILGDQARAASAFKKSLAALGWNNSGDYYQTPLRDAAGVVALAMEADRGDEANSAIDQMTSFLKEPSRMNTQEKAYLLLAAQAMAQASGEIALSRNGEQLTDLVKSPSFAISYEDAQAGVTYGNISDGPIFSTVTVSGSPKTALPAQANGINVTKRIAKLDGSAVSLNDVRQNDRFVIVLSARAVDKRTHPAIFADLLPAGFEIETILSPDDGGGPYRGPFRWVGQINRAKVAEARDDRFVSAIDMRNGERVTLAYIVRAVTPGKFVMPGVVVEDMYRPAVNARTATTSVTVGDAAP